MKNINDIISKAKDDVNELIKKARDKKLEAKPGCTMMESFEIEVNKVAVCIFNYRLLFILYIYVFQSNKIITITLS